MIEAIAESSVPLRPDGLALLIAYKFDRRAKEEAKRVYLGNIQHSILSALMKVFGGRAIDIPSYGDFVMMVEGDEKSPKQMTNAETLQAVRDMLDAFL